MDIKEFNELKERKNHLTALRDNWEKIYQDITDYVLPHRGRFFTRNEEPQGGRLGSEKIFDSAATIALRMLAAGMHSGLTSPSRPWFQLSLTDKDLMNNTKVKIWLNKVEDTLYRILAGSNFYSAIHMSYEELAAFGTAVVYVDEDSRDVVRFLPLTAGEYCLATDSKRRVNTIVREFFMTAKQLEQKFGRDNISAVSKNLADQQPDAFVRVAHMVYPREEYDFRRIDRLNKPYASVYFEADSDEKNPMFIGGYDDFPFMCSRWTVNGHEVYGKSPVMDILPDVKMLQAMSKGQIKAVQLVNDPPLRINSDIKDVINLFPGGRTYVSSNEDNAVKPLYQVSPDINGINNKITDLRNVIKQGLFNDLFLMLADAPQMTAKEVSVRHEEKMLLLGPVIERHTNETLTPLLERTFSIAEKRDLLPEAPKELLDEEIKIEYVSVLAQAQKMYKLSSIQSTIGFANSLVGIDPTILEKINPDMALKEYAEALGSPAMIMRTDEEIEKLREEKVAQQEQMAKGVQMEKMLEYVKDFGDMEVKDEEGMKQLLKGLGVENAQL